MRDTRGHAKTQRRTRSAAPRSPWGRLLPLLLAYGLVLALSPVGQAGYLWVHLATEHHEAPRRPATEPRHDDRHGEDHDPEPAHRHGHGGGEHAHDAHHAGDDHHGHGDRVAHRDDTPVAPDAPHAHGGRVHTHDQAPVEDPAVPAEGLSRYYLPPAVALAPLPVRDGAVAPSPAAVPRQAAPRIDTPPPRLPG